MYLLAMMGLSVTPSEIGYPDRIVKEKKKKSTLREVTRIRSLKPKPQIKNVQHNRNKITGNNTINQ
jgi:hypothetical protein